MRAIMRQEYGSADVLELLEVDEPVAKSNDVLVQVRAAGVNMADVDYMLGRPRAARLITGWRAPRNRALGIDVAGVVEAVGKDVTRFGVGDEVFGDLTDHGYGAFAEFACAREDAFAPKPTNLTFEEAATVPQAGVMALQGLRSKRRIEPGQQVLINGAGGNVGPFAVQIAKSFGAEVTGVDSADKLEMLRSIGADHVIDYEQVDVTKIAARYDRILDVAAYRSLSDWKPLLTSRGVYIAVPMSLGAFFTAALLGPLMVLGSGRKMGVQAGRVFAAKDVADLTELVEAGKVRPIIDRRYSLTEVPEALRYQESGRHRGKLVITM